MAAALRDAAVFRCRCKAPRCRRFIFARCRAVLLLMLDAHISLSPPPLDARRFYLCFITLMPYLPRATLAAHAMFMMITPDADAFALLSLALPLMPYAYYAEALLLLIHAMPLCRQPAMMLLLRRP